MTADLKPPPPPATPNPANFNLNEFPNLVHNTAARIHMSTQGNNKQPGQLESAYASY